MYFLHGEEDVTQRLSEKSEGSRQAEDKPFSEGCHLAGSPMGRKGDPRHTRRNTNTAAQHLDFLTFTTSCWKEKEGILCTHTCTHAHTHTQGFLSNFKFP